MARTSNPCPAQCSGGHSRLQDDIAAEKLEAAGVTGEWITRAVRCGYCDEIYSREHSPARHVRRGHFAGNTLITAENWRPHLA
jgi:uncharacterized C2H2 Zn-finger protein